jgi:hypothetical protein
VLLAALAARGIEQALARRRAPDPARIAIASFLALTVAALGLRAAAGTSGLYDRYLWGVTIAVLVLLPKGPAILGHARRLGRVAAAAGVLLVGLVSLAVLVEENTSSAARWQAGEAAVARGLPATSVDAGFEWMGWHYPHLAGEPAGAAAWADPASWYNVLKFPAGSNCMLMSYAPREEPWLEPVEIRHYDALLAWADRSVFVYRNPPACAGGGA